MCPILSNFREIARICFQLTTQFHLHIQLRVQVSLTGHLPLPAIRAASKIHMLLPHTACPGRQTHPPHAHGSPPMRFLLQSSRSDASSSPVDQARVQQLVSQLDLGILALVGKGLGVPHRNGITVAHPCTKHNMPLLFCSRGAGGRCATTICLSCGTHVSHAPWLPVCHRYRCAMPTLIWCAVVFCILFFASRGRHPVASGGASASLRRWRWCGAGSAGGKK
jgi:hypothetical protein